MLPISVLSAPSLGTHESFELRQTDSVIAGQNLVLPWSIRSCLIQFSGDEPSTLPHLPIRGSSHTREKNPEGALAEAIALSGFPTRLLLQP